MERKKSFCIARFSRISPIMDADKDIALQVATLCLIRTDRCKKAWFFLPLKQWVCAQHGGTACRFYISSHVPNIIMLDAGLARLSTRKSEKQKHGVQVLKV
ncbi:hypothetical protein CEXT_248251 [Caerostris extrusa]|uniref:Uncharacterized protein n=1 Tax=Caerostris extrusa TaxID=172846 RepID=A0AAV4XRP8_CAEEX|nr:hypothetical protein CEXT_248251 [Caerostris extrusa]